MYGVLPKGDSIITDCDIDGRGIALDHFLEVLLHTGEKSFLYWGRCIIGSERTPALVKA